MPEIEVAPVAELPSGTMRLIPAGSITIGVYNCAGTFYAIEDRERATIASLGYLQSDEDRCSHDDGPLCEGDWEPELCVVVCPRHGSRFDLQTGIPMSLPAFEMVPTYPVSVREDGVVVVEVPE